MKLYKGKNFNQCLCGLINYAETNKKAWGTLEQDKYWLSVTKLWCKLAKEFDGDKVVSDKLNRFILNLEREFKGE